MPGLYTAGFPQAAAPTGAVVPADLPGVGGAPPLQVGVLLAAMGLSALEVITPVAGVVTIDLRNGNSNFATTLVANSTLANPITTGMTIPVGFKMRIKVTQDATGSRTLAYGSQFKFPGGAPTATTTANATDIIDSIWDGTNWNSQMTKAYA